MNPFYKYISILAFAFSAYVVPQDVVFGDEIVNVSNIEDLAIVQELVGSHGAGGSGLITIKIAPGFYELEESFRINRSNVSIIGEPETMFLLAAGVNQPVVAIGTQKEWVDSADIIENIRISGIIVDGSKDYQESELNREKPWIRNNGIDVRGARNLEIDSVVARNNRSGGLVISWKSSNVVVTDSLFEKNFFDGVAYYDSIEISTTDCIMRDNQFAGISLDNDLVDLAFTRCLVEANGDVGVFARNTKGLRFLDCTFLESSDWAVFSAHDLENFGVHEAEFEGCQFEENRGGVFMASVDDAQSSGTRVLNSTFVGNEDSGRGNIVTSGSTIVEVSNAYLSTKTLVSASE